MTVQAVLRRIGHGAEAPWGAITQGDQASVPIREAGGEVRALAHCLMEGGTPQGLAQLVSNRDGGVPDQR